MPFQVPIDEASRLYPEYDFVRPLTPSEQKAAFHVRDKEGNDLCLKMIAPSYDLDRLNREIRALQTIRHPNVVRLVEYTYSSTPEKQVHHIIEEFVEGSDLTDPLNTGPWTTERASEFFAALSDGLAALDDEEVVHRDLKPSNIRVRNDGSPVIIDFGLARHLTMTDLTKTEHGARIGTPLYFSPEQFEGTKYDIDHRTDLFAVGVLMYEALVGYHPFWRDGMSFDDLSLAVRESTAQFDTPEFLALPPNWQLLIKRLLEKSRERRPNRASQVATMLRKLGGA